MKRYLWLLPFLLCLLLTESSTQEVSTRLTKLVESELSQFSARTGLYAKNLETGEEVTVRSDAVFNSASVIKLAIMGLAYELADQDKLNLNDGVVITRADLREDSRILEHRVGRTLSLRELITYMITESDNAATELMVTEVGGKDRVNEWLIRNGFKHTRLQVDKLLFTDFLSQFDPQWTTLTPEESTGLVYAFNGEPLSEIYRPLFTGQKRDWISEAHRLSGQPQVVSRFRDWTTDPKHWFGSITPRDAGKIIESIERGTIAKKASCDEMREILLSQQLGAGRIPRYLSAPVAHKTGEVPPFIANDVGIVYSEPGPIIISIFTGENAMPYAELEERIGQVSRVIVDHFGGYP